MSEAVGDRTSDPPASLAHLRACLREQLRAWPATAADVRRRQIARNALDQRPGARRWLISPEAIGRYPPRPAPARVPRESPDEG